MSAPTAPQTAYIDPKNRTKRVAGMIADNSRTTIDSYANETAAGLLFGRFVAIGADSQSCKAIAAAGDVAKLAGVTVFQSLRTTATPPYAQKDMVPVARVAVIAVEASAAIAEGDSVYITHTGADAGLVRGSADATATIVPGDKVKCREGAADGELALLEVNIP